MRLAFDDDMNNDDGSVCFKEEIPSFTLEW